MHERTSRRVNGELGVWEGGQTGVGGCTADQGQTGGREGKRPWSRTSLTRQLVGSSNTGLDCGWSVLAVQCASMRINLGLSWVEEAPRSTPERGGFVGALPSS